jgi:hypothetical protein
LYKGKRRAPPLRNQRRQRRLIPGKERPATAELAHQAISNTTSVAQSIPTNHP